MGDLRESGNSNASFTGEKAKVELSVQVVERWIMARLRQLAFASIGEVKQRQNPPAR